MYSDQSLWKLSFMSKLSLYTHGSTYSLEQSQKLEPSFLSLSLVSLPFIPFIFLLPYSVSSFSVLLHLILIPSSPTLHSPLAFFLGWELLKLNNWTLIKIFMHLTDTPLLIYLFIYFWLCWVFVSVWRLSLVMASGGHSSSRCAGLSPPRPLLLWSTSSRHAGSAIVAHGLPIGLIFKNTSDQLI